MIKGEIIRKNFIEFFKNKSHQIVKSASLIPADPTALFTSAGMQQFVPYLSGEAEPPYSRACSVQKCFRTSDIDEVGDEFHHTFFEMLGNWSFGDYFKKEAIAWSLEFLINECQLEKDRLWVTIFKGFESNLGEKIPYDSEAEDIWQNNGIAKEKIKSFGIEDNFWGPVGAFGPCGPCSEIHYDLGKEFQKKTCLLENCGPNCGCGRFVEIWNLVFMEYNKDKDGHFKKLINKNIDTGAGLERLICILQNKKSDYQTDLFLPIMEKIKEISLKNNLEDSKESRIIADHIRGACFLIADGVMPSKEDRGYVLRRIIRRAMRYGRSMEMEKDFLIILAKVVINLYQNIYPDLAKKQNEILTIIRDEQEKFNQTLNQGLKKIKKVIQESLLEKKDYLEPEIVFHLYDTYGFPLELTKEIAIENNLKIDDESFQKRFKKHQNISRAGVKSKFGGVGEWGEQVAPHHSATHLLHQALRLVLGDHVQQAGSDLTPERIRFDFTHQQKMTESDIKRVEQIVNEKIKENLEIKMEEMSYLEAINSGALAFFKEKYPEKVRVYSIGEFSKEICAGPHAKNTKELGEFKIIKEKASGAGVRRIKAILIK